MKILGMAWQHAIPLSQQLEYFKEYKTKLAKIAGNKKAASIIQDALYVLSSGTADFLQNYYFNSSLSKAYTPSQYSSNLVTVFTSFVKVQIYYYLNFFIMIIARAFNI